jgi:hypothetical protein
MNFRTACVNLLLPAALVAGAFWLYGELRVMAETFGMAFRSMGTSAAICFAAAAPFVAVGGWFNRRRRGRFLFLAAAVLIAGMATAEFLILGDEQRFFNEVSDRDVGTMKDGDIYSRDRAWPHRGTTLVFVKGKGFHATD